MPKFPTVSLAVADILPNPRNSRTHSKRQIDQIAESIKAFGFASAVVVDQSNMLLAGHGRWLAAKKLGIVEIPAIVVADLSGAQMRALMIADNRIAENAGWDRELLAAELKDLSGVLSDEGGDICVTGFEVAEIDSLLQDFEEEPSDPADEVPAGNGMPLVTQPGDMWCLGPHRLLCGDAREKIDIQRLMNGNGASMVITDPPYNVAVSKIGGRGKIKHSEFAMASGEMTPEGFERFLETSLSAAGSACSAGALLYAFMDWRNIDRLVVAGRRQFGDPLNICVWVKASGGQGSFYRSQHEMVAVFRVGDGTHRNNVQLGRFGRNRTNVWSYRGANSFGAGRMDDLRAHPTAKPVAMIADAIKDCTRRGDIVLDPFCGVATTILAAERVGRTGFGIEIEPKYVDTSIRRWQSFTRKDAILESTGETFAERAASLAALQPAQDHSLVGGGQ